MQCHHKKHHRLSNVMKIAGKIAQYKDKTVTLKRELNKMNEQSIKPLGADCIHNSLMAVVNTFIGGPAAKKAKLADS